MNKTLFYRTSSGFASLFTGDETFENFMQNNASTELLEITHPDVQSWLLETEKATAKATVAASAEKYRARISGDATQRKMASWPVWRNIALEIQAGKCDPQDRRTFEVEVKIRGKGETVEQLCEAVLRDARRYQFATALINGLEYSTKAAIDKVTTVGGTGVLMMRARSMADAQFEKLLSGAV